MIALFCRRSRGPDFATLAGGAWIAVLTGIGCGVPDPGILIEPAPVRSVTDPDFSTGDVSPDGRYFSDINWSTGDLDIVNLASGERRRLTGTGYEADRYAWSSAFSTDGRRIAVSWYLYGIGTHELRVTNVEGTGDRVLVQARDSLLSIEPLDWSPSDEHILVALLRPDHIWQLGLASVLDGSLEVLKTLGWLAPGGQQSYPRAYYSPDGRYVGYDYRPRLEERSRSIYALPIDGGDQIELLSGPDEHRFLGWTPDGRAILFYRPRGDSSETVRLPVRNGRPDGEPHTVHVQRRGIVPLGITRAGIAVGIPEATRQIETAALDLTSSRMLSAPQPLGDAPWRSSLAGDWSPDGAHLAYVVHDPPSSAVETLVIRTAVGEPVRELRLSPTLHTSSSTFRWVDANTIVLFGVEEGRVGIYRMDVRDGSFRRLPERVTAGAGGLKWFGVGPGGRTLYFVVPGEEGEGEREIVARDAETGEQRLITTARTNAQLLDVSPDGRRIAYVARHSDGGFELRVTATDGSGSTATLYRGSEDRRMTSPVAWTPDGSRILFVMATSATERSLWSIDARGEEQPIPIDGSNWCCGSHALRIHPEGRRLLAPGGEDLGSIQLLETF